MPHIRFPRTCSSYNWSFVPSGQPSVLERGSGWPVPLGPTVPGPQREQAWGGVRDSGLGAGASRAASFACSSRRPLPGAGPAVCGSVLVARRLAGLTPSFPPLSSELLPNGYVSVATAWSSVSTARLLMTGNWYLSTDVNMGVGIWFYPVFRDLLFRWLTHFFFLENYWGNLKFICVHVSTFCIVSYS